MAVEALDMQQRIDIIILVNLCKFKPLTDNHVLRLVYVSNIYYTLPGVRWAPVWARHCQVLGYNAE